MQLWQAVSGSFGGAGYAAFGNDAPSNLLTGFGFYNPWWLLDLANLCVVIHIIGTWQVRRAHTASRARASSNRCFPAFVHACATMSCVSLQNTCQICLLVCVNQGWLLQYKLLHSRKAPCLSKLPNQTREGLACTLIAHG